MIDQKSRYDSNRVKQSSRRFSFMQKICKEVSFGMYDLQIKLQLYESMVLSSRLFNSQSRTKLRISDIQQLQDV